MKELKMLGMLVISLLSGSNVLSAQVQLREKANNVIVPGKSIGYFRLGMSKNEIISVLKEHKVLRSHRYGIQELDIRYESKFNGQPSSMQVLFVNDRAIQIATDDNAYSIKGGYNIGTDLQDYKKRFPSLVLSKYYLPKATRKAPTGEYRYYGVLSQGVAISFVTNPNGDELSRALLGFVSDYPEYIVVHYPKRKPIPIIGGAFLGTTAPAPLKTQKPKVLRRVALSSQARSSARKALRRLQNLESAVNVGLTYSDYSNRLVDAYIGLKNDLKSVPESDLKKEIMSSMLAFDSARDAWTSLLDTDSGAGAEIIKRLNTNMRQQHWTEATQHLRNAERLLL